MKEPSVPVYRSVREIPVDFGPCVASIGNFDGVHLGHREILSSVVAEARALDIRSLAITFDPHPERFLRPDRAPRLLTPMDRRIPHLASTGIDAVLVLDFNAELASLSAEQFAGDLLANQIRALSLHEGGNFRFGHRAEAGVEELKKFGAEFGFSVHVHSPVHTHGL